MPDQIATETSAPAPADTAAPAPETPASSESVYDAAYAEAFAPQEAGADAEPAPPVQTALQPQQTAAPAASPLTHSQKMTLERAKLDPALVGSWPIEQIDGFVSYLQSMQASQDQLGAELGRLKQAPQNPATETQAPPEPFGKRVASAFSKLAESYDEDIKPIGDFLTELSESFEGRMREVSEQQAIMGTMGEMLTDMALDAAISGLTKTYPSIDTEEGRGKVVERFWKEWNTGEYRKEGSSLRQQVREAAQNAAKVTFNNTTEASAAASLVSQNKARVAAQPRVGSSVQRKGLPTVDDIYNEAYEATMAKA